MDLPRIFLVIRGTGVSPVIGPKEGQLTAEGAEKFREVRLGALGALGG